MYPCFRFHLDVRRSWGVGRSLLPATLTEALLILNHRYPYLSPFYRDPVLLPPTIARRRWLPILEGYSEVVKMAQVRDDSWSCNSNCCWKVGQARRFDVESVVLGRPGWCNERVCGVVRERKFAHYCYDVEYRRKGVEAPNPL